MRAAASARAVAAVAVARVLGDHLTLDEALSEAPATDDARQKSAAQSLSYGAVRGYFRHEAILQRLLTAPLKSLDLPVRALLSIALYEIEDAKTPQYAVVDAAVETARAAHAGRAAGLVNAVLRRYLRERTVLDAQIAALPAARHAAPQWLADRLRRDWPARWQQVLAAMDSQAPMWLRVDARRSSAADYVETLRAAGMRAAAHEALPFAVALDAPCDVHQLPGFAQGLVSVQDFGAQCVAAPLALASGQRILDACAAPGGKTALIAERQTDCTIVGLDIDAARLARARENMARGDLQAILMQGDASHPQDWWDGQPFDRILLDAPCSALGVIRRHPDIRLRKSLSDLEKLPMLQGRLLRALWPLLNTGGRLIYVTCTLTRSENREVVAAFLREAADAEVVAPQAWRGWPPIGEADEMGMQILPGEAGADGFYYAALTKR